MKNRFSINKRNPRQLFFVVGAFCAYGLLVAGLIVLSAGNPLAQGKAALGTAAIGLPASGTGPASKPTSPSTAAFPILELHHKAKGLPVELFDDLN